MARRLSTTAAVRVRHAGRRSGSVWRVLGGGGAGDGEEGVGEHRERDVPVPAVVAAHLVLVEPGLPLGGLEAFLDGPPGAGDPGQLAQRGTGGAVAGVVGEVGRVR